MKHFFVIPIFFFKKERKIDSTLPKGMPHILLWVWVSVLKNYIWHLNILKQQTSHLASSGKSKVLHK